MLGTLNAIHLCMDARCLTRIRDSVLRGWEMSGGGMRDGSSKMRDVNLDAISPC
jgi:hypothetical protein